MRKFFETLRQNFETAFSNIASLQAMTLDRANSERKEFIDLLARMQKTQTVAQNTAQLCEDMSIKLVELAVESTDLADKIECALSDPEANLPSCNYEDLVGFCEECGEEVTFDHDYDYDDETNTVLCDKCMPATTELAESIAGV